MRQSPSDPPQVLYEDNHLIAVHKPAGILVQGDRSGDPSLMEMIKHYIKRKYTKPGKVFLGLVHRLDRPVSGVVLFARTSKAAARLSEQWRSRTVTKRYWALVHGLMVPSEGTLTSYLRRTRGGSVSTTEKARSAREAVLTYRTLHVTDRMSLLEIHLHTGRKHQIRAQLASAGCPVAGDTKYGAPPIPGEKGIRLSARSLTLAHPIRRDTLTIEAPPPKWALAFLQPRDRAPIPPPTSRSREGCLPRPGRGPSS